MRCARESKMPEPLPTLFSVSNDAAKATPIHLLARGDYLRAAVFLLEGVVTRLLYDRKLNPSDFTERKDALEELRSRGEDVKLLADVRNAMAHGLRSSDVRINKLLSDEAALAAMLQRLADAFTRDSHS